MRKFADSIEKVILHHQENEQQLTQNIKQGMTQSDALATYVQAILRIDLSECPPDFREVFIRYANACEGVAQHSARRPQRKSTWSTLWETDAEEEERKAELRRYLEEHRQYCEAVRIMWGEIRVVLVRYDIKCDPET